MKSYVIDAIFEAYKEPRMTVEERFEKYYGDRNYPESYKQKILEEMRREEQEEKDRRIAEEQRAHDRFVNEITEWLYGIYTVVVSSVAFIGMAYGFDKNPLLTTVIMVFAILVALEWVYRSNQRK